MERELKFPNYVALARAQEMLPDCGRSSVRSREDYEPSISGGFWPVADVMANPWRGRDEMSALDPRAAGHAAGAQGRLARAGEQI